MEIINQLIFVLVVVFSLILGLWIFFADKKSCTAQSFLAVTGSIVLWIIFSYFGGIDKNNALFWYRLNFAAVSLTFISFYFLADNFPSPAKKQSRLLFGIITIGLLFTIISASTDLIIKSTSMITANQLSIKTGTLGYPFYAYIGLFACLILYNFVKKYFISNKQERSKIVLFLIGLFLYATFNIVFNLLLPVLLKGEFFYYQFGDYSAIFFLGFTAYAIIKRGLFNIKVVATETTVIALSIGLLIETFVSNNITEGAIKGIIWILATYGGYILIKSVKVEIKQKEELQKLARKLDVANQHLEELGEAKDNFLSMAAHELNTPIAAIEGYLSMIIDEKMAGNINEKAMGYLKNIYGSSKRLAGLVKNLLNVSRIESNRIHLIFSEIQIEDVIAQSIAEIKIKADEIGHKLTFEKSKTTMPKTWFDAERITEVIINIIGNAIKYTEPPGKIVVSTHTDGDKIVVAVEDNGRGIPKDKEEHIFEKFAQVNVLTDQVKGTGLGMFITKNLIALHKGKVWFKSSIDEKDHGTTFYFSLPILKEKPFDPHEGEGALFQTPRRSSSPAGQAGKPDEPKKTDNADSGKEPEAAKTEIEAKSAELTVSPTERKAVEKEAAGIKEDLKEKNDVSGNSTIKK